MYPRIRLSRSSRALAKAGCAGYTPWLHTGSLSVWSFTLLLPTSALSLPGFEITDIASSDAMLTITASAITPGGDCPRCGTTSQRNHSYYTRNPRDLPIWDHPVCLVLRVRRVRCLNAACPMQTFAERLPHVVRPAAQRTVRLTTSLQSLGLALGGEAGARLGSKLRIPTSPDTLLRLIRQLPYPPTPTPAVLGVDDWVRSVPSKQAAAWG